MRAETTSSAPAEEAAPVSDAVRAREQGLSLLRKANRWLIGLAVLLAGAFTGLTAHAFHSSSSASAQTVPATTGQGSGGGTTTPAQGSGGGAAAPGLQSPASPPAVPQPAPAPAGPVVSGGS